MFGYVMVNKPELKIKDFETYQSFYCGLCKTLKTSYGRRGQVTLTYDMTFLILFLTALYEPETKIKKVSCLLHPLNKHTIRVNEISEYAADMNILVTYYKLLDDWKDDKSLKSLLASFLYRKKSNAIGETYKRQSTAIKSALQELFECEKRKETNIDVVCRCFGKLTEELFIYKEDEWEETLRKIGFFLGKFIYLLDAYDDLAEDRKKNHYNPFLLQGEINEQEYSKHILTLMMAECAKEFEKLPIIEEADILRNIIYSGVWMKYEQLNHRKDTNDDI
ncbi:MAG: DUF5685 family protein [Velocimicrobium sp.]